MWVCESDLRISKTEPKEGENCQNFQSRKNRMFSIRRNWLSEFNTFDRVDIGLNSESRYIPVHFMYLAEF